MAPVEIFHMNGSVILRARNSELLIIAHHVQELRNLKASADFASYFLKDALVNRPARKLFEAWLKKDRTLWPRLYNVVQREIKDEDFAHAHEHEHDHEGGCCDHDHDHDHGHDEVAEK